MDFSLFVTFTKYIVGCPDDCTNPQQGTCDGSTGTCSCAIGFGGENCAGKTFYMYNFVQNFKYIKLNLSKKTNLSELQSLFLLKNN